MQYFYLLNNKDIYGVDGRFFGPNLSVCDCVDYFKHLGVQEGTLTDINIGGLNGCYQYTNDSLIYKGSSCGGSEACNQIINFDLISCKCQVPGPGVSEQRRSVHAKVYTTNPLCGALEMQYQVGIGSIPSPNWNVNEQSLLCPSHAPELFTSYYIVTLDGGSGYNVYVRFRWKCYDGITYYNGIWQPSAVVYSLPTTSSLTLCPNYGLPAC